MIFVQPPRRGWTSKLTIDGIQAIIHQQRALYDDDKSPERFSAITGLVIVLGMLKGDRKMDSGRCPFPTVDISGSVPDIQRRRPDAIGAASSSTAAISNGSINGRGRAS